MLVKPEDRVERIEKEYSDFLYAISHDLAAPIRHVNSFARILENQLSGSLDEKQAKYLHHIIESSNQLSDMLLGLLRLSRLNSQARIHEPVDVDTLARKIIHSFEEDTSYANTKFAISSASLPTVTGDAKQLEELFTELLENALKFSGKDDHTNVKIAAEEAANGWVFSITDTGPGLDEKYHDKVFEVFAKGPDSAQTQGIGIGLTLARRIVEQHGGDISLGCVSPKGLNVCFTLAKDASNDDAGG